MKTKKLLVAALLGCEALEVLSEKCFELLLSNCLLRQKLAHKLDSLDPGV